MTKPLEPRDLWIDDHLTDAALSALADGQIGIVAEDACHHAETCAACSARLAELAVLGESIAVALAPVAAERTATVRRFPVALVAAALALAALGAAPSIGARSLAALSFATALPERVPQIAHVASLIAHALAAAPFAAALPFLVFAFLALSGAFIARSSRRRGALS
jgi:hypothetical protein